MPRKPRRRKVMPNHGQMVMDFIKAYEVLWGVTPSYEEIAKGLGLKSKSNVHRIIHALKDRGYLTVKPYTVASIKLVDKTLEKINAAIV